MATQTQMLESYLKSRFVPGQNTNLATDTGYQTYQNELDKQRKIQYWNQQAQQADQAAAVNNNRSAFGNVLQYGPSVVKQEAVGLGTGVVNDAKALGTNIEQGVRNNFSIFSNDHPLAQIPSIQQAQQKAQGLPQNLQDMAKNITPGDSIQLLKLVSQNKSNSDIQNFLNQAVQRKAASDKKVLGTAAEVASLGIGAPGLAAAAKEGLPALASAGVQTAAGGAVGGAGNELATNPNASLGSTAKAAGLGAAFGVGMAGLGAAASKVLQPIFGKIERGAPLSSAEEQIINEQGQKLLPAPTSSALPESRGLPAPTGAPEQYLTPTETNSRVTAGENPGVLAQEPQALSRQTQAPTNVYAQLNEVNKQIRDAQLNGGVTAADARSLIKQRQQLVEHIQNGTSPTVDPTVPEPKTANANVEENTSTIAQSLNNPVTSKYSLDPSSGVPMAAQRTEKLAVEKGLAESYDLKATPKISLADQADKAVNLLNTDYEKAKQIALGQAKPPGDLLPSSVYKAVEARAAREKDGTTLYKLATQSEIPGTGKSYGQYNAAFAFKDPESPLTGMQSVIQARKASKNPNVPKDINPQEADNITKLAGEVADKKAAMANGADRFDYGKARVAYDNYINQLKVASKQGEFKNLSALDKSGRIITELGGLTKGAKAALDFSRTFRQDWKTVFSHPKIWAVNTGKSFKDAVDQFGGKEVLDSVKADIVSRPNAPLYEAMQKASGIDLFPINEEAFPSNLLEKTPGIRRLYKTSEAAFTAGEQRQRADLTDLYVNVAKQRGVDLTDKKELASFGEFIGDLTSRGKVKNAGRADLYNKLFFAPRNLKANLRFLTAEQGHGASSFVRREAAKNLIKTAAGTALILQTAAALRPGSVERDPRSSNFGKIRIGDTRFDMTGGMASLTTLAMRLLPTMHDGKMGLWSKSSTSNQYSNLLSKQYGKSTALDTLTSFAEGKASPIASTLIDIWKGQTFSGDKVTPKGEASNLFTPLGYSNYTELKNDPKSANKLVAMLADSLGISTNTYSGLKEWTKVNSQQILGFKAKVDPQTFSKANSEFNNRYDAWSAKVQSNGAFQKLSDANKQLTLTNAKKSITNQVLKQYGYTYKTQKNPQSGTIKQLVKTP